MILKQTIHPLILIDQTLLIIKEYIPMPREHQQPGTKDHVESWAAWIKTQQRRPCPDVVTEYDVEYLQSVSSYDFPSNRCPT